MLIKNAIYRCVNMQGVAHTTLNPRGPGTVRIHLVPPKFSLKGSIPSVVILNGKDILPINSSWAILLNVFIEEVNFYEGNELTDATMSKIVHRTTSRVHSIFPKTPFSKIENDLVKIVETLCDVAYGKTPQIAYSKTPKNGINYMTLGEYAPHMKAPHRIDLMVSSMCKDGYWNCNQRCLHCYAAGQSQASVKELSTKDWKKVIDKCRKIGIPQLTFTGGEPTIRKDLVELINYSKWFVTRLNTNGINLTEEFCEELYQASLDSVQITLYSSDKDVHDYLVGGPNKFDFTVQGIKNAIAAGLNVSVNTPLCSLNMDYVETLAFLRKLGVKYVTCSGMIVAGNAEKPISRHIHLSEAELTEVLKHATNFCNENHMEIDFTSPGWVSEETLRMLNLNTPTCGACLSNMAIAPNGNVVPCQSWLSEDASLGNILKSSWKKIWNSSKCVKIRNFSSRSEGICPLKDKEALK